MFTCEKPPIRKKTLLDQNLIFSAWQCVSQLYVCVYVSVISCITIKLQYIHSRINIAQLSLL